MGRGSQRNQARTKNQRRDDIERKRDERSQRNALRKEKQANAYGYEDDTFKSFRNQLQLQGFKMRDVVGDGNCLFRALADQMDGNENMHFKHRKEVVTYMTEHEDEFIPFLEETVSFKDYLKDLSSRGTYGGNDSIVAFARGNGVDVVIHQLNNPTFIIGGGTVTSSGQKTVVHLAYHDFEHYSSVRRSNDPCSGPAHTFHKESDSIATEKCMDKREDVSKVTDQGYGNNIGSRKEKRRDKKKQNQEMGENKCEGNYDFISEAVEEIRTKCDCDDTEYIKNVFVDNSYDIDSTLSFILQTMQLDDNIRSDAAQSLTETIDIDESAVSHHVCDTDKDELHEVKSEEQNEDEENKEASSSSCAEPCASQCYRKSVREDKGSNFNEVKNAKRTEEESEEHNEDVECDDASSSSCSCSCSENTPECNCKGVKEEKESNFNETKKKNVPSANKPVVEKHLSNRQRKELAKQARKKRRQETRKTDSNANESSPLSEQAGKNIKSITI